MPAFLPALAALLPALVPLVVALAGAAAFCGPGMRPRWRLRLAEGAAILAFVFAAGSAALYALGMEPADAPAPLNALSSLLHIDAVSLVMLLVVTSIGWAVLRYSSSYLDGEERQGAFTGWMCLTLAAVLLFVQAGSLLLLVLAWIAASYFLQKLILFYPERLQAKRALRKYVLVARAGDGALILAALGLYWAYGTFHIPSIAMTAQSGAVADSTAVLTISAGLLALAAILKSAQFPFHGWLTEVMDTPTPVSALLHAGVINAGGILLIRFADVMLLAPGVLAGLLLLGGFTALCGGLVMLTQPSVKNSLAWSTIAQMGLMILQCGLALFPLALLHIAAHSFYKAHAFLSSGSAVENVAAIKRPGPIAIPNGKAVAKSFTIAIVLFSFIGVLFGFESKSPQTIALGAILIFGVAYLLAQGLAGEAPRLLTQRTVVYSLATTLGYFALHSASLWLTEGALPAAPAPGPLEWALIALAVLTFGATAFAQSTFPIWSGHPAAAGIRVHLSNGLYINALYDRYLKSWQMPVPSSSASSVPQKG
ncbi:proton-conducting transporter transmembrane domain-containing protein [Tepidicaulis sp. LMO-SS28]|uniref:proton-conducting transporter transmembrane domain-containing protein n=1 Tax=Tepidicaulis sp. LMO-SS28 TaxID=3447455 RepID=UPI003EDEE9CD